MSLNTNGWDYIYTATITKLNGLMVTSGPAHLQTLIDTVISDGSNQFTNFTLTKCEVIASEKMDDDLTSTPKLLESTYPDLYLKYTCAGNYGTTSFTDLVCVVRVNINWLNKTQYYLTNPSELVPRYDIDAGSGTVIYSDISLVLIKSVTLAGFINPVHELLKNYINEKVSPSKIITNPLNLRYDKYYKFFIGLNPFGKDGSSTVWMKTPKIQMLSVKYDVNQKITNETCYFSFSCMIRKFKPNTNPLEVDSNETDKVRNNDIGYVDLNAIPKDASSALVIERSVFGEHMVMPKLLKIFELKENNGEKEETKPFNIDYFDKKVTNSFRLYQDSTAANKIKENQTLSLVGQDYKGTFGVFKKGNEEITGSLNEINLKIEENLIRVTLPAVNYFVKNSGWPYFFTDQKIIAYQEYEIYLTWVKKIIATTQTKAFDLKMDGNKKTLLNYFIGFGGLDIIKSIGFNYYDHKNTHYIKDAYYKKRINDDGQVGEIELTELSRSSRSSSYESEISLELDIEDDAYSLYTIPEVESSEEYSDNDLYPNNDETNNLNPGSRRGSIIFSSGSEDQKRNGQHIISRANVTKESHNKITNFNENLSEDIRKLKAEKEELSTTIFKEYNYFKSFYENFQIFRKCLNIKKNKPLLEIYFNFNPDRAEINRLDNFIKLLENSHRISFDTITEFKESVSEMIRLYDENACIRENEKFNFCYQMYIIIFKP